jgi:hypothetical protein
MRSVTAAAVLFAAVTFGPAGFAQSASTDALLREGVELRRQGRDADALEVFRRAYAVDQSPIALAQMGLAEQALGSWLASEAHVRAALAVQGNPWIDANRSAIETAYSTIASHVGTLELDGVPAGAEITVDGTSLGRAPLGEPIRVEAHEANVEVHAVGYRSVSRRIDVGGGGITHAQIVLEPESATPRPSIVRPLAFVAAGGAVLGLALGFVGLGVRESLVAAYNDDPFCPGTDAGFEPMVCQERIDRAAAMRAVEIAGFVSAGVFAAASVTLWLLAPRNVESHAAVARRRVAWTCGAGPGAVGIACTIGY